MTSNVILGFPKARRMTKRLSEDECLNLPEYKDKGLTDAVIKLAVKYFAGQRLDHAGRERAFWFVLRDLVRGKGELASARVRECFATSQDPISAETLYTRFAIRLRSAITMCAIS